MPPGLDNTRFGANTAHYASAAAVGIRFLHNVVSITEWVRAFSTLLVLSGGPSSGVVCCLPFWVDSSDPDLECLAVSSGQEYRFWVGL